MVKSSADCYTNLAAWVDWGYQSPLEVLQEHSCSNPIVLNGAECKMHPVREKSCKFIVFINISLGFSFVAITQSSEQTGTKINIHLMPKGNPSQMIFRSLLASDITGSCTMCSSRKYPYSSQRRDWNFLGGVGCCEAKKFNPLTPGTSCKKMRFWTFLWFWGWISAKLALVCSKVHL